jgi:hypothetical protein
MKNNLKIINREDEESRFPEKLRNLIIMPSDDERMEITTREDEELP